MKRIKMLVFGVLLSLCLCVPAMGSSADSPGSPDTYVKPEEGVIEKNDGTTVDMKDPQELAAFLNMREASAEPENIEGYAALNSFDVTLPADVASAEITMHVPGVKKGDVVIVRVMVNGQWVNVEAVVVDDNKVRMKLMYSGTVEILKESDEVPGKEPGSSGGPGSEGNGNTQNGTGSGKNTSAVSPKTGEAPWFPAACAAAVLAGCAALAAGYKAKKSHNGVRR